MAFLLTRAVPVADCFKTDSHGNVINLENATITFAGHPRVVALASFVVVAAVWVATLALFIWSFVNLPPRATSHDMRRSKWVTVAVLWFLIYLTADATLRFLQYHGYTFPIEVMYTELARVKPQGLAEYFCFVAILRCEDVFTIGGFNHFNRWKYMRLFLLVLLTLVDLVSCAGDYYYRISMIEETVSILTNNVSTDDCTVNSVWAQYKTYADIIFYGFSLACCVFFTCIVAKFKIKRSESTIKTYRLDYSVVIAAFWAHCIQCLIGTLVFGEFNVYSTQTTELIYVIFYDITMLILILFLIRMKKLELGPEPRNYEGTQTFIYTDNGYVNMPSQTSPFSDHSAIPYTTPSSTAYEDLHSKQFPTSTIEYAPTEKFESSLPQRHC